MIALIDYHFFFLFYFLSKVLNLIVANQWWMWMVWFSFSKINKRCTKQRSLKTHFKHVYMVKIGCYLNKKRKGFNIWLTWWTTIKDNGWKRRLRKVMTITEMDKSFVKLDDIIFSSSRKKTCVNLIFVKFWWLRATPSEKL